jgi:hypothetical protein
MKYRYIPKGSAKVANKHSDAVAYVSESNGAYYAVVYYGEQSKPVANYRYRTAERRAEHVAQLFAARQAHAAALAKRKAERKAWVNDYKVGDVVNTCWGYEQTNREYYEVIAVKGKKVTIREIATKDHALTSMSENVVPLVGQYIGEPKVCYASERGIKTGKYDHTYATRTSFDEIGGFRVYRPQYVSHYA